MANSIGSDIQVGKWYPADQLPPDIHSDAFKGNYNLLLGIQNIGVVLGDYSFQDGTYSWFYQRYDNDGIDDEPTSGKPEINSNPEWDTEPARGVSCWMIIPAFDKDIHSFDGSGYFDPSPVETYKPEDDKDNSETPPA
ncbi:hypothetical protein [Spirosoma validum]|uniref:Uncharacterized protein n=1 Tax=Spirosoma validum TaxID=2771355 RepID=A0A927GD21_9BACT|nr:hypothetical protein [Spirosoma validum]MBD2753218.1 hypothetical protein [Spirosoma validum]